MAGACGRAGGDLRVAHQLPSARCSYSQRGPRHL
uniref:Uncharacterized protein n=1 Tax=Myoviridae sp. ctLIM9 TaxID=2827678 RepID=A0A8S5T676_9CAUD|nr:MAG TPA: hypothetical protein [Myoviridae sp. ctLIM9]DAK37330.1 MAG TPA: hypothetical protein [Caudoviricetes sp.]DAR49887.1 MAG TPA: hypothetical protein [Caudoviricetes sp.]DAV91062.1 MAG TPA: hypothetical protein [Caudoviricetes sp.]DAX85882.1 MAG TPA: hypothetical protein [Bacteriophage sp.]